MSRAHVQPVPVKFSPVAPEGTYIQTPDFPDDEALSAFTKHREGYKYPKSQNVIKTSYCHTVVHELESLSTAPALEAAWIDAGPITTQDDLMELVTLAESAHSFPFVLEIASKVADTVGTMRTEHTAVLLGKDDSGYVVWEKAGDHLPFQLTTLANLFHAYVQVTNSDQTPAQHWRLRQLAV